MTDIAVENSFPVSALVPKAETGVLNFLQKYPQFDGRDTTIAIFDSGVDPRAAGLTSLCDGKSVKVIERFDCTGCGDVDTSKVVTADARGEILGVTGRWLKLTPQMIAANISNGEYHVGSKLLKDLVPSRVHENSQKVIKTKDWDGPHKTALANAVRKINEFEAQNSDTSKLSWDKKFAKENLDSTLEMLMSYEKQYNEIRPTYDCVVYKTENGWEAVIDITEKGDLENALHIGEYTRTHEIKNINDFISVSINVHDEGKVLEIVGMCSSHGTHVASIASGNQANKELNGVAPNAKIVSITIGDSRLGSMETGAGLVRGMTRVMQMCKAGRKIDVINMSYGEHSSWSNYGRIGKLICEVVNVYGVVWVASAGNHGPALCTVGTPPDVAQPCCIGVGAYVSPQMMEAEYALREKLPANLFTWTSRDPCIDGGHAVTICAPGGAVTSVPQFNMCKSQFMNGTSMAAPHVAGAIALLISGLKQSGISYSPFSIKRALCNTATKVGYADAFAQGSGLMNVEKAFEHMLQFKDAPENPIRFQVLVGPQNAKGIHIREGFLTKASEHLVTIEPVFFNDIDAPPKDKIEFNVHLTLVPSESWVQCGSFLDLSYSSRSIMVKVDPIGLAPGVHTALIRAYDSECIQKGVLFKIPITVVQPHVLKPGERYFTPEATKNNGSIEFKTNTIQRDFILVPRNATWAVLRMRSTDKELDKKESGKFYLHTMQLLPKESCRELEFQKLIHVNSENESTSYFHVQENNILELCIAKYWSNLGSTHIRYSLEFHGIIAKSSDSYIMRAACGIHKMWMSSFISEELMPTLQLKYATVVFKPTESKITPLSNPRDVLPDGRQIYQNILTYTWSNSKSYEVSFYAPLFNSYLYEAEYESQLWMLFDANKMQITSGDAKSQKTFVKLEKGDYTIRLQIRHEKRDLLEKISDATMLGIFKLNNTINMDVYDHYNHCLIGGKKCSTSIVRENSGRVLYIGPLAQDKLTKANLPTNTSWLDGLITFSRDENARKLSGFMFTYLLNTTENGKKNNNNGTGSNNNNANSTNNANSSSTVLNSKTKNLNSNITLNPPSVASTAGDGSTTLAGETAAAVAAAAAATTTAASSPKKQKASDEEYMEGLRDFQCSMITKCDADKALKIYNEVIDAHPKHLLAHLLLVQNIESNDLKPQFPFAYYNVLYPNHDDEQDSAGTYKEEREKLRSTLERIIELTDIVVKETDKDALLAYYGLKYDSRPDAAKIKANMDKQKNNLLEALTKKGISIAKLGMINGNLNTKLEELDNICLEILKFVEANDSKVVNFSIWHAYAHEQDGRMYKYLSKLYEEKKSRECLEELEEIAFAMKLDHLVTAINRQILMSNPTDYRLF